MTHDLTISAKASDYLTALHNETKAAQRSFDAALTAILREKDVEIPGPIKDLKIDGPKLTVTFGE